MFHVRQKVVCIGDYTDNASMWWAQELCIEFPERGGVYTVRRIVQRQNGVDETAYGIMLEEILNVKALLDKMGEGGEFELGDRRLQAPDEMAFNSLDFRPLITVENFVGMAQREDA